ncbi:MAG: signal peptide peptidase SppA [Bacteroidales bacterium]|nr:signal peptide peptidase SppA [Candidatus Colimorpha pelethequi]
MEQTQRQPLGFGKTMLASALGVIIASAILSIIGFLLMVGMLASAVASSKDSATPIVGDHIFLKIDLSKTYQERTPDQFTTLFGDDKVGGFCDLLAAIEKAKTDSKIDGLYIYATAASGMSWGQTEELRNAVKDFIDASGKPVVAYGDSYSQSGYYLASVANKTAIHPSGMVDFRGIGAQVMYYKDLLDKFDIKIDLIRPESNAYKSAGETYIRNNMSDANRIQIRTYITSIWNHVTEGIAAQRNLTVNQVNEIADNLSGYLANDAVNQRLIDTMLFENDIKTILKKDYGCKRIVSTSKYAKSITPNKSKNKIAVIYAEGDVVDGKSNGYQTAVYSDDIVEAFEQAAKDKDVKAIVLRVNSPGGSVTASEAMTHAIMKAKKSKPIIVSMSDLAASAGYEISCNATKIVAQPTTITGSIGVFATIPEIGDLLNKKLGIHIDTVCTNKNADGLNVMHSLSPTARAMMQRNVEDFYVTFCQRVAKGRGMRVAQVDSIAKGRVWTGADAIKIGLVDTLGGFDVALSIAAKEAGISDYTTTSYPKQGDVMTRLFKMADDEDVKLEQRLNAIIPFYSDMRYWANMAPLQARLPYAIEIK